MSQHVTGKLRTRCSSRYHDYAPINAQSLPLTTCIGKNRAVVFLSGRQVHGTLAPP